MKTITIYGSCVSREPFNQKILKNSNIKIDNYFQRNNIISLFTPKLSIDESLIFGTSNFVKRMTYYDLNKKTVEIIKNKHSDFIIIDFTELRFGIINVEFENIKTKMTNSDSSKNTLENLKSFPEYKNLKLTYDEVPYWYSYNTLNGYIDKFVEFIISLYKPENIILVETLNCIQYINDNNLFNEFDNIENLVKENYIMKQVSDLFYEKLNKKCYRIQIPYDVTANKNHWLGFSPLHYEDSCYEYIANCFCKIIMENGNQSDLDNLYEKYYDELKIEKRKVKIRTSIANQNKKL